VLFGIKTYSPLTIIFNGLSFNCAGYLAENFSRWLFQAIPVTQINSARCLGMKQLESYTRIVIPQVLTGLSITPPPIKLVLGRT